MKKNLLFLLCLLFAGFVGAQEYDYETEETSVTFTYFGSSLSNENAMVIDNPNASGINTSSKVAEYVKAQGSETWAGAFANPLPSAIATEAGAQICIDVHFDHMGNLGMKLENSTNGVSNWITVAENTVMNEWETLCYDLDANGLEDDMTPAAGGIFTGVAMFFDFGSNDPDKDVTTYFDNLRYVPPSNCATIFDFEDDGLSTNYTYFGSTLQDQVAMVIDNPNPTGVNTTAKVLEYVKAQGSETWAGAYAADPQPTVDATNGTELCVDVHMDHLGNIGLKLEQSGTIGNWIRTVENTVVDQWETVCVDLTMPGLEDDMTPAAGHEVFWWKSII